MSVPSTARVTFSTNRLPSHSPEEVGEEHKDKGDVSDEDEPISRGSQILWALFFGLLAQSSTSCFTRSRKLLPCTHDMLAVDPFEFLICEPVNLL